MTGPAGTLPPPEIVRDARDAALGISRLGRPPARAQSTRDRRNAREREQRARRRAAGIDPALVGVADIRKVLAVAADPDTYALGDLLWPPKRPGTPGRPRDYHGWVYIVIGAGYEAWGDSLRTIANLREPVVWQAVLAEVRAAAGDQAVDGMRRQDPPTIDHWNYLKKLWKKNPEIRARFHEKFRLTAVGKAVEQGRLDPAATASLSEPDVDHYAHMDGVVAGSPSRALERVVEDPETGLPLKVRYDDARGLHYQGGEDGGSLAQGTKWNLCWNRGRESGTRLVLDVRHQPAGHPGGEGAMLAEMLRDLVAIAPGTQGVLTDMILRGKHLAPIMDAGLVPIVPVTAWRKGENYRIAKDHALPPAVHTAPNGRACKHELMASDGSVHLRTRQNNAADTLTRLPPIRRERRDQKGRTNWYLVVEIPCRRHGSFTKRIPVAHHEDGETPFNRLEYLRLIAPGDQPYARAYPRRVDAEAGNRELKRLMPDDRIPAYGPERQHLVMLMKGHAINAVSRWLHRNPQAVRTGPPIPGQRAA